MTVPAVVVSGHIAGLGVVRSLGRRGVRSVVVRYRESGDVAHESRHVSRSFRVPHPAHDEGGFIRALERLGPDFRGSPLIPAADEALVAISRHRARLGEWFRVLAAPADVVDRIVRKEHTYALAERIGVVAPRTHLVRTEAEIEAAVADVGLPCVVKPSESHLYEERFHRKLVRADSRAEALTAFRDARAAGLGVLVQELIPGGDTGGANYNSLRVGGEVVADFTAAKIRLAPPAFGAPSVVQSRHIPDVVEPARRILDALGYDGYSCVEFKRDSRSGRYVLMEVNGRPNLSILLSAASGLDFAWTVYRHLVAGELPAPVAFDQVPEGRWWIDATADVRTHLRRSLASPAAFRAFARPYLGRRVFAVFDPGDPRPVARRYGDFVVRRVRRRRSLHR